MTVALGGRPVTRSAQNSLDVRHGQADGVGDPPPRHGDARSGRTGCRAGRAGSGSRRRAGSGGPGSPRSIVRIRPSATSRTSIRLRVQSIRAGSLPRQKSRISRVGGESPRSPGPTGIVGLATTTGWPARARAIASFSARSFDRQYGPTASARAISTSSAIGPVARARVRMLSVLVCRTRSAPAAERGVEHVDRPAVVHRVELAAVAGPEVRVGRQVVDPPPPRIAASTAVAVADVGPDRPRRPPAGATCRPPAARPPGPARPAPTSRSTRWLPMNPAPPVTIVIASMRRPPSISIAGRTRRAPAGPERPRAGRGPRRRPAREQLGGHERGEPVIARRAIPLDLVPVDVDVGDAATRSAPAGPPRETGRAPGSRRLVGRRPCCRRSGGRGGRPPPGRRAGPSRPAGSSASSRARGGLSIAGTSRAQDPRGRRSTR